MKGLEKQRAMLLTVSFESLSAPEVSCSQPDGRQLGKQADDASIWSGNQDARARIRLQQRVGWLRQRLCWSLNLR